MSHWLVAEPPATTVQVRPHEGFASRAVVPRSGWWNQTVRTETSRQSVGVAPEEWTKQAMCLGQWEKWDKAQGNTPATAAELCEGCPVIAACLSHALRHEGTTGEDVRTGIRGGMLPKDRAALSRSWSGAKPKAPAAPCPECGKERPVRTQKNGRKRARCRPCERKAAINRERAVA